MIKLPVGEIADFNGWLGSLSEDIRNHVSVETVGDQYA